MSYIRPTAAENGVMTKGVVSGGEGVDLDPSPAYDISAPSF